MTSRVGVVGVWGGEEDSARSVMQLSLANVGRNVRRVLVGCIFQGSRWCTAIVDAALAIARCRVASLLYSLACQQGGAICTSRCNTRPPTTYICLYNTYVYLLVCAYVCNDGRTVHSVVSDVYMRVYRLVCSS